jgi:hypothetical protein
MMACLLAELTELPKVGYLENYLVWKMVDPMVAPMEQH